MRSIVVKKKTFRILESLAYFCVSGDGWTTVGNENLVLSTVSTEERFDAIVSFKTFNNIENESGENLANLVFIPVIRILGPSKVTSLVTDNAANMVVSRELVLKEFTWILDIRCMCHLL